MFVCIICLASKFKPVSVAITEIDIFFYLHILIAGNVISWKRICILIFRCKIFVVRGRVALSPLISLEYISIFFGRFPSLVGGFVIICNFGNLHQQILNRIVQVGHQLRFGHAGVVGRRRRRPERDMVLVFHGVNVIFIINRITG